MFEKKNFLKLIASMTRKPMLKDGINLHASEAFTFNYTLKPLIYILL